VSQKLPDRLSNQQGCWSRAVVTTSKQEGSSLSYHCLLLLSFSGWTHAGEPPAPPQLRQCPRAKGQELLDGKGWERNS